VIHEYYRAQCNQTPDHVTLIVNCACVQGVWSGMVIGGTLTQTLILLWVTVRTDWNKEVIDGP
jgi:hypothetical protein